MQVVKNRTELLVHLPKQSIVAEIGVQQGKYSQEILIFTNPKILYLIDCWETQDSEIYDDAANVANDKQLKNYALVTKLFAKTNNVNIIKEYSGQAVARFKDQYFDWIYIDGNHSYDGCSVDLDMWSSKVKCGGYLCGHDYKGWPGVTKAVDEFIAKNKGELSFLTSESDGYLSYAIKKK